MFELIKVDDQLADTVERELSFAKPKWQYSPITTPVIGQEELKRNIDIIKQNYPVHDTQKFSDTIYNAAAKGKVMRDKNGKIIDPPKPFVEIRQDPRSRYNQDFPNTARLLDYLQHKYIPKSYVVKRFLINMQTIRPVFSINEIHPDFMKRDFITILYYVNSSDGDTYFFEGSECVNKIPPIKGTAAMYPSYMLHAGSTPTKTEKRIVINFCFGPKE